MEELAIGPSEYIPAKMQRIKPGATLTTIEADTNGGDVQSERLTIGDARDRSMHSTLKSSPQATVYVAAPADRDTNEERTDAPRENGHSVTIRVNAEPKAKAPVISSVHLKNGETFQFSDKKSSIVRLNADDTQIAYNEARRTSVHSDKNAPYIYCSSYPINSSNLMSSGQCSPSDTLDSGTCSDLDSTPPPLPKKKSSKATTHSGTSVTVITFENANECSRSESNHSAELDFEDNDSNISCDSLNSSELNGSIHEESKRERSEAAEKMPAFPANNGDFLREGLLRGARERSAKLEAKTDNGGKNDEWNDVVDGATKENTLTSFLVVSQIDKENIKNVEQSDFPKGTTKVPIIDESTYEDRQKEKIAYSSSFIYDADKFYDFHLNEKVFEPVASVVKSDSDEPVFFAGVKDYNNEEVPATIRSSKGTVRGVKNRVRAGIATFLQIQTSSKSYREKDAGKVVLYSTTMGIVRPTYQRCLLVKKILRNLLVKYEERDVFMSAEYQDEIRDRMRSDDVLVPQLFIEGQHIGDADTVEKLNESGELRKMLKPYKSLDACNTCQTCGGFRLLPCRVCNGSKKSLHRNHFTTEFVALKCMNCDEVGLIRCDACC